MEIKPEISNASIFAPYPGLQMTQYAIKGGYFDGNFDKLESTYWDSSVLKFKKKSEKFSHNKGRVFAIQRGIELAGGSWLWFIQSNEIHEEFSNKIILIFVLYIME